MTKEDIMKAGEICEILNISLNTLYDWRYREKSGIPVFRQGKYLFAYRNKFGNWYNGRIRVA